MGTIVSDDKTKTGGPDRTRISLSEDYAVRDRSKKFGVTADQLRAGGAEMFTKDTHPSPWLPQDIWVDQFANELGRHLPSISPENATRRAVERFKQSQDSPPTEAAGLYLAELPPLEPENCQCLGEVGHAAAKL